MSRKALIYGFVLALIALPVAAQKTPRPLTDAYGALADTILSMRDAESSLVRSVLDYHFRRAERAKAGGDWKEVAAEMALFANEGDNTVAGIRKRLLEGGHHFNAAGEEAGMFEEGFVVVTRKAKKKILDASAAIRTGDAAGRDEAWTSFVKIAEGLQGEE